MIVCTELDKEFDKYKNKVKSRKVVFSIKSIFLDWWNKFPETNPNLKIRSVVLKTLFLLGS